MLKPLDAAPAAGRLPHAGGRVLIVEDEFLIADSLKDILEEAGYVVVGLADSVAEAMQLLEEHEPNLVLLDIYLKGGERSLSLARALQARHIPFIYISANSNESVQEEVATTQPAGYIVKPFRKKDLLYTLEIAAYRHAHGLEQKLRKEQALQIALTDALSADVPWDEKLLRVARLLQPHIPFDLVMLGLEDRETTRACSFFRIGFEEYQTIRPADFLRMTGLSAEQYAALRAELPSTKGLVLLNGPDFERAGQESRLMQAIAKSFKVEANLLLTLPTAQGHTFTVAFYSRQPQPYQPAHLEILDRLRQSMRLTLERVLAFDEIARLSEQLGRENRYLQEEVRTTANFEEIIGTSAPLLAVFKQVAQVAPADTSVLILGESGTGKELFARAVHNLSPRRHKLLVKVNCATLPANLIESELFGHEKGAFTGATERRIGKFELAHRGTIFLDEIGEMPLDLQTRLLRVLQEKEIERLGGTGPIKTDVRIIAATNRHLEKEVAEGRFRLDLYYRLSVFPLHLPPLRDRSEDIAQLAQFFAQKYCRRAGKPYHGISTSALAELLAYSWPGNIRELENIIEQAVIINDGQCPLTLGRPLVSSWPASGPTSAPTPGLYFAPPAKAEPKTLAEVKHRYDETERDTILAALTSANGRIRGSGGAAELLNLKPTTLEYRMEKLGIRKASASENPES
ncbi:sigma 54-interacting transcriptional regulator [Hymenobacter negativus]|uniref:Sigma 54-interacting transcriptional regulator n=1 Tax=Hymenobacter negativus TaxID=2795026 RepID=A0ABS3QFE5_9BACT|nr:sigma 54-interacting transcriptional regulator [Hymenobacter negativus]MBO2009979.1 sigma 54-interacting transcriptional regulator [Hymenobacter negativus]